ncbi:MAG TPA: hypothetical protein VF817_02850 [Patescibacteria group bacterium]
MEKINWTICCIEVLITLLGIITAVFILKTKSFQEDKEAGRWKNHSKYYELKYATWIVSGIFLIPTLFSIFHKVQTLAEILIFHFIPLTGIALAIQVYKNFQREESRPHLGGLL